MSTFGFIGMGNMGYAMLKGLLKTYSPADIVFSCATDKKRVTVSDETGVRAASGNAECANSAKYIILAVKPQVYDAVIRNLMYVVTEEHVIISLSPSHSIDALKAKFEKPVRVVRAMPNTPALIGEAMTGVAYDAMEFSFEEKEVLDNFFKSFGTYRLVDEKLMNAVTCASGSSPAYVYMFIEAMADACVKHGMPRQSAYEFVAQTVVGAGRMVLETNEHPGMLKDKVCSPGGTTIAGVAALEEHGFRNSVIKAVDEYADLLRTSVATPGNDHRLGANEAPPAIISIFVGEELEAVIDAIASDSPYAGPVKMKMDLGVDVLPKFSKDTTDRNRTSPFAFTGNKFEFRMPGSAENLSDCNTILNTAVAKELKGYADELEKADDFTSAAIALVKRTIRDHRRVIFNGNGYTAEWEAEAAKRGLPNKKNTPAALPALIDPKNIQLMEDFGVLTKVEMESRYEVELEHYSKIINIEALTMLEMARKQLLPAINAYMSEVANTAASKLAVSEHISVRSETKTLEKLSSDADAMSDAIDTLQDAVNAAKALPTESEKAVAFHDNVLPVMDALRAAADDAETICGEDYWPLPSYSKMLYYV